MREDHIIHRMRVELRSADRHKALTMQRQISYELHKTDFRQRLEAMLNDLLPGDEYVEIPSLAIHLELDEGTGIELELLHALKLAIEDKIRNRTSTDTDFMRRETYEESVKIFFLRYGILRFENSDSIVEQMIREIRELSLKPIPELEKLLMKAADHHPAVWKRIYYLMGADAMKILFLRISGLTIEDFDQLVLSAVRSKGNAEPVLQDVMLWEQLFVMYTSKPEKPVRMFPVERNNEPEPVAESPFREKWNGSAVTEKPAAVKEQAIPVEELERGFEIRYAGIVLLWVEFGKLLHELQLVKDRSFVDDAAKQQAVLILHYMAAGHTEVAEEDLLLNKMLCNWPLNEPVEMIELTEQVKTAADDTLEKYIANWRKDRKFSANWFRAAYLQREGRLHRKNDGQWELTIKHKTEDILINKVSIIRYSWMHHLLFIRW